MRDILTILAGLVIAVLAAALALPPLVDWTNYRGAIDRGLSRALGQEARTEGQLDLRLLPTPRLRARRVRIGQDGAASLDAMFVRAEIALTPLLGGEVRVLDARIGRAEVKLPVGTGGDWRVPVRLLDEAARRKSWALEELRIEQFLLTTFEPYTGRTDQYDAENVRIEASSALGPWRLSGKRRGRPLDVALGEIGPDRTAALKIGLGGEGTPRLDLDGQLALVPDAADSLRTRVSGVAKWAGGSPEFPIRAQANVTASGGVAELTDVAVEAGEGAASTRLGGEGRLHLAEPWLELKLAGRRVDAVAWRNLWAARAGAEPHGSLRDGAPVALDLSLRLDNLAIGADEDLSGLSLALSAEGTRGELRSLEVAGPGRSRLGASGSFRFGLAPGGAGRVSLVAADGPRLARSLESLGLAGLAGLVQPGPIDASAEVSFVDPVVSLRNLRVAQGDLRISGSVRHSPAEEGVRARLDAQLAIDGLDVSALPQAGPLFALARGRDLGLAIDARDVVHGGRKGGRITGRIMTEGTSILVDGLEVRDLAGARANLSGRIAPDGTGRIEGTLAAPRAAPLFDLFGQAAFGGMARLVPAVIRDGAADLRVDVERMGGTDPASSAIQTILQGRLGGAPFEGLTRTSGGVLGAFEVKTDADALLGLAPRGASAPRFTLSGGRGRDGRLAAEANGEIAGLRLRTLAPIRFGEKDDRIDAGELSLEGPDAKAALVKGGLLDASFAGPEPLPVALKLALSRRDDPVLLATGDMAGTKVAAELTGPSLAELTGTVSLDALSLPRLASWLMLGPVPAPPAGATWPTARFAEPRDLPFAGTVAVRATALDLGLGIVGRDAGFTLALAPGTMRLSRLDMRLGEARLRGEMGLDRQGGLAALSGDAAIDGLALPSLLSAGRLTAKLRFGASGESVAGLIANLGGAGDVTVEGLRIDEADAAAPARLAARVLKTDDPLASQRWQALLGEELGRAPLTASGPVTAPGALVGGALRLSPLRIDAEAGSWQGAATLDLRNLSFDARGALQSKEPPRGWTGAPPTLGLGWAGPLGKTARAVDAAPLVNGLATNVLSRELDRIDTFEQDAAEQRRRSGREEMERQRRADEARRQREREAPPAPPTAPRPTPPSPPPANPGG